MEKGIKDAGPVRRIAVTGPESTGKSELSRQLAQHYHTEFVPDYSREYIKRLQRPYEYADILKIAKGQLAMEDLLATKTRQLLFCDTDLLVNYVWSTFKYHQCDPFIEERLQTHRYDLYLLCNIDLPWEADPLREHPHQRKELFDIYRDELEIRKFPFKIINGTGEERIKNAIGFVEELYK